MNIIHQGEKRIVLVGDARLLKVDLFWRLAALAWPLLAPYLS